MKLKLIEFNLVGVEERKQLKNVRSRKLVQVRWGQSRLQAKCSLRAGSYCLSFPFRSRKLRLWEETRNERSMHLAVGRNFITHQLQSQNASTHLISGWRKDDSSDATGSQYEDKIIQTKNYVHAIKPRRVRPSGFAQFSSLVSLLKFINEL